MAGTFARSSQLVRESWHVLKQDKELVWFPILSIVSVVVLIGVFVVPAVWGISHAGFAEAVPSENEQGTLLDYALLFIFYLVTTFVGTFFMTGVISNVTRRLKGENPTLGEGLRVAKQHLRPILWWSLVSATVGVVLKIIQNRTGLIGRLIISFVGFAWGVITVFVVPVMILEKVGVGSAIRRSRELFAKTWGENVVGGLTMSLFFFVLSLPGFVITFLCIIGMFNPATLVVSIAGLAVVIIYFAILVIIHSTLESIFFTVLYHYAATGTIPSGFSPELVQGAYKLKK